MDKDTLYEALVQKRKACQKCVITGTDADIVNSNSTQFDTNEIGHWSNWQANLNADVLIIGQDWGDFQGFEKCKGEDADTNPTNKNLRKLLEVIGVTLSNPTKRDGRNGVIFLTNSILCMKKSSKGMQAKIKREWVENCGQEFLAPLIDIVNSRVIISLGSWAYLSVRNLYSLERKSFRRVMHEYSLSNYQPTKLPSGSSFFPMYHCGTRVVNAQRGIDKQICLWEKIKLFYWN